MGLIRVSDALGERETAARALRGVDHGRGAWRPRRPARARTPARVPWRGVDRDGRRRGADGLWRLRDRGRVTVAPILAPRPWRAPSGLFLGAVATDVATDVAPDRAGAVAPARRRKVSGCNAYGGCVVSGVCVSSARRRRAARNSKSREKVDHVRR